MKKIVIYGLIIAGLIIIIAVVYKKRKKDADNPYDKEGKLKPGWVQPNCAKAPCPPMRIIK